MDPISSTIAVRRIGGVGVSHRVGLVVGGGSGGRGGEGAEEAAAVVGGGSRRACVCVAWAGEGRRSDAIGGFDSLVSRISRTEVWTDAGRRPDLPINQYTQDNPIYSTQQPAAIKNVNYTDSPSWPAQSISSSPAAPTPSTRAPAPSEEARRCSMLVCGSCGWEWKFDAMEACVCSKCIYRVSALCLWEWDPVDRSIN